MNAERWWPPFVEVVTLVWILLFVVDIGVSFGLLVILESIIGPTRGVLQGLLVVFLLDVVFLYRWSDNGPKEFVRSNWFLILTVIPWFRPLRALRIGRSVRVLSLLSGSRRIGSFLNKIQGKCRNLWHRLHD